MMKKHSLYLILAVTMLYATSCRDKKLNHPKQGEELKEVKKTQSESMEKYKEWSDSDKEKDSTTTQTDSTDRDSLN
ncbi:hypothetical protein K1F50_12410 [Muricauda oceani]|uniref:Uncharacterized protein n=1 Tax=Flagellimonas oceani TaxID=2698672 RepID=A0A6G7J0K4_9FLAO|nr:hypothetical protein [Allomuricauda oceani]MBW8243604.1 hypothetical protein [Allomuricauda oceani]QII44027.1 hypothetical protein GVT53_04845 [Allomuricauda oceani]